MIAAMLNNLETEEHRSDLAKAHIAIVPPLPDHDDETGGGGRASARSPRAIENEASLPVVWQGIHAAYDRRKPAALLLDRASAGILDRRAPLDDASDRDGAHTVQCLKASQASVHAAREVFQPQEVTRA
jgi:hypothetical protein